MTFANGAIEIRRVSKIDPISRTSAVPGFTFGDTPDSAAFGRHGSKLIGKAEHFLLFREKV